jgi:hypothetical protein
VAGLAFGAGWAALLLAACWVVLGRATHKVVVQGG